MNHFAASRMCCYFALESSECQRRVLLISAICVAASRKTAPARPTAGADTRCNTAICRAPGEIRHYRRRKDPSMSSSMNFLDCIVEAMWSSRVKRRGTCRGRLSRSRCRSWSEITFKMSSWQLHIVATQAKSSSPMYRSDDPFAPAARAASSWLHPVLHALSAFLGGRTILLCVG